MYFIALQNQHEQRWWVLRVCLFTIVYNFEPLHGFTNLAGSYQYQQIPLTFHISVIKNKNAIFENLLIIVIIICFLIACQFEIYRWQSTSADISAMAERNFNCEGEGRGGRGCVENSRREFVRGGGLLPYKIFEIYRLRNGIFNILNEAFPLTTQPG